MLLLQACVGGLDPAADGASDVPALVINEVMTANESVAMTTMYEFDDWIELYNAGDVPLDLSRAGVSRAAGLRGWVGEGELAPGARRLLWARGIYGPDTLPFRFDDEGASLVLTWDGKPVDHVLTGALTADTARARFPDGGDWALTARPTPNLPNGPAPTPTDDPSDTLFDLDTVHAVDLVLSDEALAALHRDPYEPVVGSLGFEGAWFEQVSIRIKGALGSLRSPTAKMALKIDVDDYTNRRLRGLEHLTLNNMVQDPTGLHEAVSYAFLRAMGVPAPRTGWVRLTLNGEDRGFYLLVETPDQRFLARWFDDPTGPLWEGAYGVDLDRNGVDRFQYDGGPEVPDRSNLAAIADILAQPPTDGAITALEERVDLDEVLDVLAFEALALHWDGYTTANNYRLYEEPGDRVRMLPWGADQAWEHHRFGPWEGHGRILTFCVANPACRARYDEALIRWADAAEALDIAGLAEDLHPLVRAELGADPYLECDMTTHDLWVETSVGLMRSQPGKVREAAKDDLTGL